jgi:hypothetical protein
MEPVKPLAYPPLSALGRPLPDEIVQREWDCTLRRLRTVCPVLEASEAVSRTGYARLLLPREPQFDLEAAERILFDNLLLAPHTRTEDGNTVYFGGEWLWRWRMAVPYRAERVGHIHRLVPWQPQHQWTYRYNLVEAEL